MQLADTKWGVIGLKWRAVPCDYKPANPAPTLAHPTPGQQPPKGTQHPPPGYWNRPRNQWPGSRGSLESDEDTFARLPGYATEQTHLFQASAACCQFLLLSQPDLWLRGNPT